MKALVFVNLYILLFISCTKEKAETFEELKTEFTFPENGNQQGRSIIASRDTLFLLGFNDKNSADTDFELLKITKEGVLVSRYLFGGFQFDEGREIIELSDGNFLLVGNTESYGAGSKDMLIYKIARNGAIIWEQYVGGTSDDVAIDAIELSNGEVEVLGTTQSYGNGSKDIFLVRLNASGTVLHEKTFGSTTADGGKKLVETSNGLIIYGYTYGYGAQDRDFYVLELDAARDSVQGYIYGGPGYEESQGFILLSDTTFLLAGHSSSIDLNHDMYVANVTNDGTVLWSQYYGGFAHDGAQEIIQSGPNKFVVIGRSNSSGAGGQDVLLSTIDGLGALQKEENFGGAGDDLAETAVTLGQYLYLAGSKENTTTKTTDAYLIRIKT